MSHYWIQLSAHRLHRQTVYRAQVIQGQTPIATTIQAWPENAGCGRAAAIGEARALQSALEWQDLESAPLSAKSLKALQSSPFDGKAWRLLLWGFALWYVIVAVIGGCK